MIDAALGRKDEALKEGRRAVEMLPVERDALNAVRVREFLAVIYAWTGEKDLACQELEAATKFGQRWDWHLRASGLQRSPSWV